MLVVWAYKFTSSISPNLRVAIWCESQEEKKNIVGIVGYICGQMKN